MNTTSDTTAKLELRKGVFLGLAAYCVWGFFPVYFKAVSHIDPLEVVSHRIVWSLAFLILLISISRQWENARRAVVHPKTLATLVATTLLIATNWLVFIYAIKNNQVLQSSLGYFMTPLVNVFLGFVILRERLRRLQMISLALAVIGVLYLTLRHGEIPVISLVLAVTFGLYGLLRKTVRADSLSGLTIETILIGPVALGYLLFLNSKGDGAFLAGNLQDNIMLPLAGIITAIPLLLFASAARRLRLATIGFLQYITPSLHFVLAVAVYNEPLTRPHLISFLFIWAGLALYTWDAAAGSR